MVVLFDSVILLLGIEPQETVIKVENNDINLKNVICVIKKLNGKKTPENSPNLNIKRMVKW